MWACSHVVAEGTLPVSVAVNVVISVVVSIVISIVVSPTAAQERSPDASRGMAPVGGFLAPACLGKQHVTFFTTLSMRTSSDTRTRQTQAPMPLACVRVSLELRQDAVAVSYDSMSRVTSQQYGVGTQMMNFNRICRPGRRPEPTCLRHILLSCARSSAGGEVLAQLADRPAAAQPVLPAAARLQRQGRPQATAEGKRPASSSPKPGSDGTVGSQSPTAGGSKANNTSVLLKW